MDWKNGLTRILQVDYPIVQAPMLSVSTPAMVAAVSNAGGLGSLPVGGLSPAKTLELITETRKLTAKPFAVNIFAHHIPEKIDFEKFEQMQELLSGIAKENNIKYEKQSVNNLKFYTYREQIPILIEENIPIVSFTFGILDDQTIAELKKNDVILIGTATSLDEAKVLEEKKVDIITAQGIEAGGHRGSFLDFENLLGTSLETLLQELCGTINKPILAAGGITKGKHIEKAFALGASGVQVGTAFIPCRESAAIPVYKKTVTERKAFDTVLTKSFSGRWARAIKNKLVERIETSGLAIPDYPLQNSLIAPFRKYGQESNDKEFISMWSGQSSPSGQPGEAGLILLQLVQESYSL